MTMAKINNYTVADSMSLRETIIHQLFSGLMLEEDFTIPCNLYPIVTSTDGDYFSAVLITNTWYPLIEIELVKYIDKDDRKPVVKTNLSQELQNYFDSTLYNNESSKEIKITHNPYYTLVVTCAPLKKYASYTLSKFLIGNVGQAGRFVKDCIIEINEHPELLEGRHE